MLSLMAPLVYNSRTQPMMSSQAYYGKSSSQMTEVYVLRETTLKTKMKTPARKDRRANFLKLLRMALKILVRSG